MQHQFDDRVVERASFVRQQANVLRSLHQLRNQYRLVLCQRVGVGLVRNHRRRRNVECQQLSASDDESIYHRVLPPFKTAPFNR